MTRVPNLVAVIEVSDDGVRDIVTDTGNIAALRSAKSVERAILRGCNTVKRTDPTGRTVLYHVPLWMESPWTRLRVELARARYRRDERRRLR